MLDIEHQLPDITSVKTSVNLYFKKQYYHVTGLYHLVNHKSAGIDIILIYIDRNTVLKDLKINNARLITDDGHFGKVH